MTHILILAVSLWLLFNLFLFAHLGPEARADLCHSVFDRLDQALHHKKQYR